MAQIQTFAFATAPALAYEPGGLLAGLDVEALSGDDYETDRARALYAALDCPPTDEELLLGRLPDGRWALVGLLLPDHRFAVEESPEHPAGTAPSAS